MSRSQTAILVAGYIAAALALFACVEVPGIIIHRIIILTAMLGIFTAVQSGAAS